MKFFKTIAIVTVFFTVIPVFPQLDYIHYFPPLKQATNNQALQNQRFYFSTPELVPFDISVYRGTNTSPIAVISGLSKSAPKTYNPGDGDNNITLVTNSNTGVVLSNSGLRFESANGQKFYVNFRGRSGSQAGSLTCKGQAALGTDFRWGGIPNRAVIDGRLNSCMGIIASQDNTTVTISGYDSNCEFRLSGDPDGITANSISITLQAGQSYVLEAIPSENSANNAGWIGATVTADKPIAMSSGGLNFGISASASRDTGIDQTVPTNLLGKEYVFIRGKGGNSSEFPVIIAYQNNTDVFVGGSYFATINDGEYVEIPGSNYSSSSPGANMFVSTSKEVYAYQCLTGQSHIKTVGMNFIAPLNCLLPSTLDEIPMIDQVAGASSGESAITIIASTTTLDSNITLTDDSGTVSLPAGSPVSGTSDWKTFYVTNLTGEVVVNSTGPIAVGTFMRYGNHAGLAGYFSGFDTAPNVDVQISGSGCFPNGIISETTGNFDAYQWYQDGVAVPGAVFSSYTPTTIGDYYVDVTRGTCTYASNTISLYYCIDEILVEINDTVDPILEGDSEIFTIEVKNLSVNNVTNLTIQTNIPSIFSIDSVVPSVGTWSSPNWIIGTMTPGESQILTITTNTIIGSEGGLFTSTVSNTQDQLDTNIVLDKLDENTQVLDGELGLEHTGVFLDDGDGIAEAGEQITFVYTIHNNGDIPLTNITLDDPFFGGTITGTFTGDTNTNAVLEANETWVLTMQYPITIDDISQGQTHTAATVTGTQSNGFNQEDNSDDPTDITNVDDNGDGEPDDDTIVPLSQSVTIDFDGIDDFVLVDALNSSATALTYMAWVKLDPTAFGDSVVMGEFNNILYVNDDQTISAVVKTDSGTFSTSSTEAIPKGIWVHLTSVYDGASLKIYINGEEVSSALISGTSLVPSSTNFCIGRSPNAAVDFINADIQEVKVYDKALSDSQIQEQVYQSLVNSNGTVVGATTNLPISGLSWSDLKLYLKLTSASSGTTSDSSLLSNIGLLLNMTTLQETTAPMPYEANNSGDWTSTATWTYGNVWDITSLPHKDWAIVSLTNNAEVTTSSSHTHLGLLLASGTSLKVANDQAIHNSQYLRLNGAIDLQGESQLIQGVHSILDPSSSGYLERDQQGHSSLYNYNYWCSPVGSINTSLNNKSYTISEVLHDGTIPDSPVAINFTASGYDGAAGSPITLATYWMYAFRNQPDDYQNWSSIGALGQLAVGEGYTHKGTGTAALSQNYTFIGKPNNGTITHTITDDNLYLVGNPYPSALDANQFIQDNLQTIDTNGDVIQAGTTTGALYFWEHWGGDSHILDYYQGGYATYNLTGATLAVPDPDVSDSGSGSFLPKRYIPVGQGFFVQGDQDGGVLEFKNDQRVFQRESDGTSVFISRNLARPLRTTDSISRMYFKFKTPEGASRHLLLGVKTGLLDGINYGYDARMLDWQFTDCAFVVDAQPLVIQAIGELYSGLMLPLKIQVGAQGDVSFLAEDLSGLPPDLNVYFYDGQTASYILLDAGSEATISLPAGTYNDRFYLVFDTETTLGTTTNSAPTNTLVVFYQANTGYLILHNDVAFEVDSISIYNMLGQCVWQDNSRHAVSNQISLPLNLSAGHYVVNVGFNGTRSVSKKVKVH